MKLSRDISIKNKRAAFNFELLDRFTAGIVLTGTEIKSIRLGKASLSDSYALMIKGELWIKNLQISEYDNGSYNNHNPRRDRKLLLTKRELRKIERLTRETGFTVVPLKLFINEKGWAKLEIAVAKGKKAHDKRESIKEKDDRRQMDRYIKSKL
ncbi:MAG: SsrA-binding protein SmpB [Bacteroidales bacterium]|jgi:SsrA-binding protein|nr:MAG: SsrA-binding protein [Bacteroidetes bacterium ADurb.Bin090]HNZ81204.1 SsrA-binding protein SmpB [Bacteroidales bacterium]HOD27041.1 SsrA-binding protein SmpB [Bacteroidales bacterium]HPB34866.1 SsrA-binding protein SmpB [Bacteroidales bacterium]HPY58357.1 SsrA-binding protein SmpB [Bacteroidales bacterium]